MLCLVRRFSKIKYSAYDLQGKKISNNLVIEPDKIVGIAEYGITKEASLDTLQNLTQEHPQAIIASSVS